MTSAADNDWLRTLTWLIWDRGLEEAKRAGWQRKTRRVGSLKKAERPPRTIRFDPRRDGRSRGDGLDERRVSDGATEGGRLKKGRKLESRTSQKRSSKTEPQQLIEPPPRQDTDGLSSVVPTLHCRDSGTFILVKDLSEDPPITSSQHWLYRKDGRHESSPKNEAKTSRLPPGGGLQYSSFLSHCLVLIRYLLI